ncbi:MAG: nickel insertion protein, partial [Candidatus Aerophobetes bacterium]|nr:nickel insertion protein [Candidatus Aerophobetes bacterium]
MRVAYFDCFSGISGDMILGALMDIGLDIDYLKKEFKKLNISGYNVTAKKVEKNRISGTKVDITLREEQKHCNLRNINKIIAEVRTTRHFQNVMLIIFCDYSSHSTSNKSFSWNLSRVLPPRL